MGLDISHLKPNIKTDKILDYFTISELEINQNYLDKNKHFICKKYEEGGEYNEVIFFEEVGFQRKKMNENFIKDFENNQPYFEIEVVKKAMKYIEVKNKEEQIEQVKLFQRDFIDNFVEGESIFWANW